MKHSPCPRVFRVIAFLSSACSGGEEIKLNADVYNNSGMTYRVIGQYELANSDLLRVIEKKELFVNL